MTPPGAGSDEPFPAPDDFGRSLPPFSLNLLVRDPRPSADFYRDVLGATVRVADQDFAALEIGGVPVMLHSDRTYAGHPWRAALRDGVRRGFGAELRLFGIDPDRAVERAEEEGGLVVVAARDKPHGWREAVIEDPDGYTWAVGVALAPPTDPAG